MPLPIDQNDETQPLIERLFDSDNLINKIQYKRDGEIVAKFETANSFDADVANIKNDASLVTRDTIGNQLATSSVGFAAIVGTVLIAAAAALIFVSARASYVKRTNNSDKVEKIIRNEKAQDGNQDTGQKLSLDHERNSRIESESKGNKPAKSAPRIRTRSKTPTRKQSIKITEGSEPVSISQPLTPLEKDQGVLERSSPILLEEAEN